MKRQLLIMMCSLLIIGLTVPSAYSNLTSTFDSTTEGWTLVGAVGPTWIGTGGNPGGYIQGVEDGGSRWFFISPSAWAGSWTGYIGGSLQFDLLKTGATGTVTVDNVQIRSGDSYAIWDHAIAPTLNVWGSYSVQLTAANFDRFEGPSATFESIMSNVTAVYILGDYGAVDTGGLDNVFITAAVPIPAAAWLLGSGMIGLAAIRRRAKL
jgi:hypothetical protein